MKAKSSKADAFIRCWPQLKAWYREGARPLPWRIKPVDPYRVWISEMMSQQSVMKTVVPYYKRWLLLFPTLEVLANASEDEVLHAWAGLGYYSRARNILKAAKQLMESKVPGENSSGDVWPRSIEGLQKLPGVGPYTAAAVLSIALGVKALPVDGNVLRVGARFFGVPDPLNNSKDRKQIENFFEGALGALKTSESAIFSQALMELGALVCKPQGRALCEVCPLRHDCVAFKKSKTELWPVSKKRRAMKDVFEVVKVEAGGLVLAKIPKGERLQGQWSIPSQEVQALDFEKLKNNNSYLCTISHNITHHKYKIAVLMGPSKKQLAKGQKRLSWQRAMSSELVLTTTTRKILKSLRMQQLFD